MCHHSSTGSATKKKLRSYQLHHKTYIINLPSHPSTKFTHLIWLKSLKTMTLGDLNMKPFTYPSPPWCRTCCGTPQRMSCEHPWMGSWRLRRKLQKHQFQFMSIILKTIWIPVLVCLIMFNLTFSWWNHSFCWLNHVKSQFSLVKSALNPSFCLFLLVESGDISLFLGEIATFTAQSLTVSFQVARPHAPQQHLPQPRLQRIRRPPRAAVPPTGHRPGRGLESDNSYPLVICYIAIENGHL